MPAADDHPFAAYLKIIGKGPTLSRALDQSEARAAMGHILRGDTTPEQRGAFLLLLRYRGETAEELAGFIEAARDAIPPSPLDASHSAPHSGRADTRPDLDQPDIRPDLALPHLDWPSYADRHRQQPWFVLSALLLARNGVRVLMHGITGAGEDEGHAPTRPALSALGIPVADSLASATEHMARHGIAYIGLEHLLPPLDSLFQLRPVLGVRTLVNTFARAINPLRAAAQIQGVVHPPYRETHQAIARLLAQPSSIVFKGGGGEAQRNPLKPCRAVCVLDGESFTEEWPVMLKDTAFDWRGEPLQPERLKSLWDGGLKDATIEAAVVGTAAIALRAAGRASSVIEADQMAWDMWNRRHD